MWRRRGSGSSSTSNQQVEEEDEEMHMDDEEGGDDGEDYNVHEAAQIYMSPDPTTGGVWWDNINVSRLLGNCFTSNYKTYATCWSDCPKPQREAMWDFFKAHVRTDPGYNLRPEWERKLKRRFSGTINRAAEFQNRPLWIPPPAWESLQKRKDDPKWKEKSDKARANRMKGGSGGKALATSTLGQQPAARAFNKLGTDATPHKLLVRSKKGKKGNWISSRAEQIDAEYQRQLSEADPSSQSSPDFQYEAYYKAAGGFDRKSRVFGLGEAATSLFTPPSSPGSSSASQGYSPSLMAQYATQNAHLSQKNQEMEAALTRLQAQAELERRAREEMQAKLAAQFGWSFNISDSCNPGPSPGPRDHFSDDGHGFGSQNVHPLG